MMMEKMGLMDVILLGILLALVGILYKTW